MLSSPAPPCAVPGFLAFTKMNRRTRYKIYLTVLAVPFLVLLHLHTHLEMSVQQMHQRTILAEEPRLPSPGQLDALSLNYNTAVADMLWIGSILYSSARRIERQPRTGVTEYADGIIELDPHFRAVYGWHNAFRYGTASGRDLEDRREANRILKIGLDYFPDYWQLARAIVMNNHDARVRFGLEGREEIEILEEAVHYAELGAEIEDAPPVMTGLALNYRNRLEDARRQADEDPGQTERTEPDTEELNFLVRRYFAADNDEQRRVLRHQLQQLGAEDELIERTTDYEQRFRNAHRTRFGYLPPDTAMLVDTSLYLWQDPDVSATLAPAANAP